MSNILLMKCSEYSFPSSADPYADQQSALKGFLPPPRAVFGKPGWAQLLSEDELALSFFCLIFIHSVNRSLPNGYCIDLKVPEQTVFAHLFREQKHK